MRSPAKHHAGFAMVTAIMLLSLTAMTMTLLGMTLSNQARRTQIAAEDAQLRQLLIAGAAFAQSRIPSDATGRFSITLPETLQHDSAQLTVDFQPASSSEKIADIEASLPHHRLTQKLIFSFQTDTWQITAAQLGQ